MKQIFHCQKWLVRPPLDTLPQTIIFISFHKVARATGSKLVAKTIPECNSVKHRLSPKGKQRIIFKAFHVILKILD